MENLKLQLDEQSHGLGIGRILILRIKQITLDFLVPSVEEPRRTRKKGLAQKCYPCRGTCLLI